MLGSEIHLSAAVVADGRIIGKGESPAGVRAVSDPPRLAPGVADARSIRFGIARMTYGVRMKCLPKNQVSESVWLGAWQAFHSFRHLLGGDSALSPEEWIRRIEACPFTGIDGADGDSRARMVSAIRSAMYLDVPVSSVRGAA